MTEPAPQAPDQRRWFRKKRFRVPIYGVAFIVLLLAALIYGIFVTVISRAKARDFPRDEWLQIYREDVEALRFSDTQLSDAVAGLQELAADAPDDITQPLSPEKKDLARAYWAQIYELARDIHARADLHRDFVVWVEKERRGDHIRGFLLCEVADMMVHDAALQIAESLAGNDRFERILNEPQEEFALPEGTFTDLKNQILNPERTARQYAARKYRRVLGKFDEYDDVISEPEGAWLQVRVVALEDDVVDRLQARGVDLAIDQTKDYSSGLAFQAWFPVQHNVADTMGNIRLKRGETALISNDQIQQFHDKLQSGDIGVTRRNWYLSNAGIPGFWPHAILYIGHPADLAEFADDPDVIAWCEEHNAADFATLLETRHPGAWKAYTTASDQGENAVLEAIAEGVVFRPLEDAFHADAVGVVRPRLSKLDVARAIDRAFSHYGKPYDYNFDFVTDETLVCSELVFKSYQPTEEFSGVNFPLSETLGRPLLPPNDLVKKFDLEWGDPKQQLDFVGFLDPRESAGAATWGTMEDFRHSWMRPKREAVR
ncbi:hypothetical protein KQI84_03725 [bacterium]|nr:hypothetical protein [bacterium]